ncbi:MAG: hypothetical protein WAJ88_03320 [Pseudolabrys sp.]
MNAGRPSFAGCAFTAANGLFVSGVDRSLTQLIQAQLTTKQADTPTVRTQICAEDNRRVGKGASETRRAHQLFAENIIRRREYRRPNPSAIAISHVLMKTAVRPIANAADEVVFDRIEMDVADMPLQIANIANNVLPITPLPDALFSLPFFAQRKWRCRQSPRKAALDETPSGGKVAIAGGNDHIA